MATAVLVAPATASAEPYPAVSPPGSVSDGTVSEGGTVTFSGRGFLPFEKISIVVSFAGPNSSAAFRPDSAGGFVLAAGQLSRRATLIITADRDGAFSVQVPLTQIGTATLVATGLTSGVTVTAHVTVVTPPDRDDGGGDPADPTEPADDDPADDDPADDDPALPTTGQSGTLLLTIVSGGAAAVLLGGVLLGFARRRRGNTSDAE